MNDLIKIYEENDKFPIQARELWQFIGSKREFTTWFKYRVDNYNFELEKDYTFDKFVKRTGTGATTTNEYFITIDMAKELCMVENNEKGKQARQYFIAVEKRYKKLTAPKSEDEMILQSMQILQTRIVETQKKLHLEQDKRRKVENERDDLIKEIEEKHIPAYKEYKAFFDDKNAITIAVSSKVLSKEFVIGPIRLFDYLRDGIKWLQSNGSNYNQPYQWVLEQKLMVVKLGKYDHPKNGEKIPYTQPLLTLKGFWKLRMSLLENNYPIRKIKGVKDESKEV